MRTLHSIVAGSPLMIVLSTALLLTVLAHLAIGSALAQSKMVTVYKPDGTRYCQGGEIPLDNMAKQLVKAEIEVVSKSKGQDGLVHLQNCGIPTTSPQRI